jgi:adenosylmethionine-8-amino-7-oxononanoate aminotransferase
MIRMSSRLVDLDRRHVWHPFTHHGLWGSGPDDPIVVIARAEGNTLIDTEGRRYLDAISSLWCNTLGHRVPSIDEAIRAQLDKFAHSTLLGLSAEPAIELAARLAELTPGDLDRVFYSDSGATAVEIALKIAAQRARIAGGAGTRRRRFFTLEEAYHGDTVGAISLGFSSLFHRTFDHLVFEVGKLPAPDAARRPIGEPVDAYAARITREAVQRIAQAGETLAAVVIEPLVQGAAGMLVQPPGYFRAVARAAREVGALVIADEVATGFWRTGSRFASEQEQVVPDILCMAKGLSGGYLPLAATIVTPAVYEPFSRGGVEGDRTFFHGHTYTGNALGCAAALAALNALESLAAAGRVQAMAERLRGLLGPLAAHRHVLEVRQRGLMVGVELCADRPNRRPFDPKLRVGHQVAMHARAAGVMLRPLGPVMVLMPPFSFTDAELDRTVSTLVEAIDAVGPRLAGR